MSKTIVQINFEFDVAPADYAAMCEQAAQAISAVEGIVWKIFIINEANQEAGGLYLFESAAEAAAYLNGPIIARMSQHPGIRNVKAKLFDFLAAPTAVTHGPVEAAALAVA